MKTSWTDRLAIARAFTRNFSYLAHARANALGSRRSDQECDVPPDFFGICVAGSADPACDDYVVSRLKELGIRCVRLDVMQGSFNERLLERLVDEGFSILLHLVQAPEEAAGMADPETQARWRGFAAGTLDCYGKRIALVEVGSTVNRRRWSGYMLPGFLRSWRIACGEAKRVNIPVAGPNVTDFEPVHNIAFLGAMKSIGAPPDVHTDNLFVERATQPEAFDHKILGRRLAGLARFDLVRKARMLDNISRWAGVSATICTQVSWSLRRIARMHEDVENKQADYTARYCCLAAASGSLKRVYWGPLIGQREGLVDDGTDEFPDIPHVTFYGTVNGQVSDFRIRPAFAAFRTVNRFVAGAGFKRKYPSDRGLEILEFENEAGPVHAVWTGDGLCARAADCYESGELRRAVVHSRDGARLKTAPLLFSESPVYLSWPAGTRVKVKKHPAIVRGIRFANLSETSFATIEVPPWSGAALVGDSGSAVNSDALIKRACAGARDKKILRAGRNRVWIETAPWDASKKLIFKQFRARGLIRKFLDGRKPDKAARSWNGAQELIRRGITTPMPIAFFRRAGRKRDAECFFVCRAFENARSVRDAFTAFCSGSDRFEDIAAPGFYSDLARFLLKMHGRGVFFRDLSAGNVLFRRSARGEIEFALIDTARARFYPQPLGIRPRLCDLMRICHPLHRTGREEFVGQYMASAGRRPRFWMKAPFVYYDLKHRIKNAIEPLRRRKR